MVVVVVVVVVVDVVDVVDEYHSWTHFDSFLGGILNQCHQLHGLSLQFALRPKGMKQGCRKWSLLRRCQQKYLRSLRDFLNNEILFDCLKIWLESWMMSSC